MAKVEPVASRALRQLSNLDEVYSRLEPEAVHRRLRVDAGRLATALGQARFGPADEAEQAARIARRELRGVLKTIRRRLGARRRLRGLVSLRSLGLRSA